MINVSIKAQDILPFVENFSKSKYEGDNQVWSVTQGNDNALYFANNHYFVRYNGVKWEKYTLPNKTIIRSVYAIGDRIYSGSYNEFGFWKRVNGKMIYTSLTKNKNLFVGNLINEEIWKIFHFKGSIYFQSFNELFVYSGNSIKRINIPDQISYCFLVDGKIFIASVNNGIYILDSNKFIQQKNWESLNNTIIHGIEKQNGITYFFTRKNGIFEDSKGVLKPWKNNKLNAVFKSEIINTARFIDNNRVAIGTAFNGIYIVNILDGSYTNVNRKNSLLNNSVLSIGLDKENDLWLGMDNGISHIEINSPYDIFSDNTGVLGSVYAVSPSRNGFILGTNHGVFDYQNKKLTFIEGSQGQVWQVNKIGNKHIVGHNDGTLQYNGNQLDRLNGNTGGWKLLKNNYSNHYFQANYAGITIYKDANFSAFKKVIGLNKPIKDIAQNKRNELWAVDNYKGLYKIDFDDQLNVKKIQNVTKANNIKHDYNVKLFSFKNEILFYINSLWYKFNSITNKLDTFKLFSDNFKYISDIIAIDDSKFLIVKEGLIYLINNDSGKFYWELLPKKYYEGKIVNEDTEVIQIGNKLIINLDDGFLIYTPKNKDKFSHYTIKIEGFYNNKLMSKKAKIKHNQSVELNVISPFYGFKEKNLFYKFNNSNTYIPILNGKILLNNLNYGKQEVVIYYLLKNEYKEISNYTFEVLKPWYFSFWMIITYFLILYSAFFLYFRWNKIRYNEKIKLKEEELKHQKQIHDLEMDAANRIKNQEYEKHILEIQIQTKASEVAGKSLSIAKQTEMIDKIKSILDVEKNIATIKSQISKVIKINSLNKNEWNSFEYNLLKSNEDFVKIISAKYTNLTAKDIKLCIYLKMNLSSKEIAPLMNISYRGVELHRYRLRKKLVLDQIVNLNLFMNNVK
jgi:AraC family chitin signaling transcriptional activator